MSRRARKSVPPVETARGPEQIRAAYRYVVNGDAPVRVHAHGQPGKPMTAFELWQFLLDVPDGEQPMMAEVIEDGGWVRHLQVRGAYAADGIGVVALELIEVSQGHRMSPKGGSAPRSGVCPTCRHDWGAVIWSGQTGNRYSGCSTCGWCF